MEQERVDFAWATSTEILSTSAVPITCHWYQTDSELEDVAAFTCLSLIGQSITLPRTIATVHTAHDWLKFQGLLDKWREERGATSSITEMAHCDSYIRIIGMGEKAIPLILRQMEREGDEPDQWFWALQILTEADPVPEEERGDYAAMARTWLNWAFMHWYLF